ncbi:UvrD-helicase domain-containing protein [Nocardioides cynanchi]|uniref:UvrD-helicase domain-containing protein n=1 Tax=Nocardioides cynanchi TaxID=2558918 RepID=UPI00192D5E97|nr:UvrD-helicase domain-containing protein [Nocardioides cynanchi]
MSEIRQFDLAGDLPTGTTLLEASAGTGKTFTVAALVTRYVAEGAATLDQLLVITFGRAASQELRERVREQLVQAERALADPTSADLGHPVVARLLDADPAEVALRHGRLRDALASFDAATIATTHQFCQTVLRSLGVAGDTDTGATLVESLDDLVEEVVDDVYLRRFGQLPDPPPFGRSAALALAGLAVGDAHAALAAAADPDSAAGQRVGFAEEVRREVDRRKRRLGVLSYDDLLGRLAEALERDDAPARERMRQRWKVVLVDEFQDTDPKQWEVLHCAFSGAATMVLIGDPKQAIYAFRGGDVVTYLAAAETATHRATLGTNRRSDAALVERLQVVLEGAALGDPRIAVRPVTADHPGTRLAGAPSPAPFRIRHVRRTGMKLVKGDLIQVDAARDHIARDCAGDIATLLASGATWDGDPIAAGHVAVLVGEWSQAELVRRALTERGIPAVVGGGTRLLTSPAGDEWLCLLEALEQPHRSGRVRAAALTSFLGHTLADLDAGGEPLTDRLSDRLRGWGLLLRGRGVAALFEAAEEQGLTARVLGRVGGERLLTDLRHVAQTLHETAVRDSLGLTGVLEWLRTEREAGAQERVRRLDSDAAAVQITTVHQSKGLQYPVVHLPFVAMKYVRTVEVARYHDEAGNRMLDVAGGGPAWRGHAEAHLREEAGEELRDLYVALTRAQSQVVTWWAPTANTQHGGLHRILFGRQPGQAVVPDSQDVRDDDYAARVLAMLGELGGPEPEPSEIAAATPAPVPSTPGALAARVFDREVDTEWRRTSYSGLIRVQEQPHGVTSEPELEHWDASQSEPGGLDETEASLPAVPSDLGPTAQESAVPSPMAALPSGAAFGSLVHGVLEETDPEARDLHGELVGHIRDQLSWWPVGVAPDELAEALLPSQLTPLGATAEGLRLVDIPLRDRLCELDFEFPLAGGDRPGGSRHDVHLRDLAPLLTGHLPADDPLASYAELLTGPLGDQSLRGYLSGSIDVVLRVPTTDPAGHRYVVVDYKTNLLGETGVPVTSADYGRAEMAAAMLHSHYPLQALLYSVVLHRYLRWRLPSYDAEQHLGGVLYLFLRGMCGPETPVVDGHVAGVFDWSPPAALVVAFSDLLEGGAR